MQALLAQQIGNFLQLCIGIGSFDQNDCIVEVAAFDQVGLGQSLDLFQEDERSAVSDVLLKILQFGHARMLRAKHRAAVVDHDREPKLVIRFWDGEHFYVFFLVFKGDVPTQLVINSLCVLLLVSNALKGIYKVLGTAIHDGNFRSRELDECVVHFATVQGSQNVLSRIHLGSILFQRSSSLCSNYEVCIGIDDGLFRKVDPLEFVAVVAWSGQDSHNRGFARVKADSREFNRLV